MSVQWCNLKWKHRNCQWLLPNLKRYQENVISVLLNPQIYFAWGLRLSKALLGNWLCRNQCRTLLLAKLCHVGKDCKWSGWQRLERKSLNIKGLCTSQSSYATPSLAQNLLYCSGFLIWTGWFWIFIFHHRPLVLQSLMKRSEAFSVVAVAPRLGDEDTSGVIQSTASG